MARLRADTAEQLIDEYLGIEQDEAKMNRSYVPIGGPHPDYQITALVLQGGGALGSYQAGVYEGLAQAGIEPNWVAGVSIGALNAAVIAGNPPERRVEQLRGFWEFICRQPWSPPLQSALIPKAPADLPQAWRVLIDSLDSTRALLEGQNGFFVPRPWQSLALATQGPQTASFYDTRPLRATLERFADFDRINRPDLMRVSVGAVNVRTGDYTYFDNTERTLHPEHFMASGALPPGFPAVEVDGEFYWDGGLVSNTPLYYVLIARPRDDALIFQVDLWSAVGDLPKDLLQVAVRQKDLQYSSRTRLITLFMRRQQKLRGLLNELLTLVPESERQNAIYQRAAQFSSAARRNVIHLIYRDKPYESYAKDYQFGMLTMNEHWSSGLSDMVATLERRGWLDRPTDEEPFVTHDLHSIEAAA
ncbi:MAG TPA: patatin-like phospholipase family protein [Steroidobacteraceae bacterium]|nr:patatin-like phospholipase family protein [Steroidobacteraceae bacterium]